MIRHSSSFFISLIIHIFVVIVLFFTYKSIVSFKSEKNEKVELKLCCVVEKKDINKPILEAPKKIIKPLPEKPKPIKPKHIKKTIPAIKEKIKEEKTAEEIQEVVVSRKEIQTTHEENISEKELNPEVKYLDENIKLITQLIQENLYYPRSARKRGITGKVVVEFIISIDSTVRDVKIKSSQSDILSRAAVKTIENLSTKFPKPKQELTLKVPITYSLSH